MRGFRYFSWYSFHTAVRYGYLSMDVAMPISLRWQTYVVSALTDT